MELQPQRPPGRADRKAARYAAEITRLRNAGYTFAAIQEALADVGIALSTSALRREVRRQQQAPRASLIPPKMPRTSPRTSPQSQPLKSSPPVTARDAAPGVTPVSVHSREFAEAFFDAHPSTLLHPPKERP